MLAPFVVLRDVAEIGHARPVRGEHCRRKVRAPPIVVLRVELREEHGRPTEVVPRDAWRFDPAARGRVSHAGNSRICRSGGKASNFLKSRPLSAWLICLMKTAIAAARAKPTARRTLAIGIGRAR